MLGGVENMNAVRVVGMVGTGLAGVVALAPVVLGQVVVFLGPLGWVLTYRVPLVVLGVMTALVVLFVTALTDRALFVTAEREAAAILDALDEADRRSYGGGFQCQPIH